jgi:hypothetical protein
MKLTTLVVIAALAAFSASTAQAQGGSCSIAANASSCSVAHAVTATMPQLVSMTLTGDVSLTAPVSADFSGNVATITDASVGSVTVRSNRIYSLTIAANTANFAAALGGAGTVKPAGDLEVKLDAASYQALSTSTATLASAQTRTASRIHSISYRTTYKLSQDEPDSYSLTLTYSMTTP